LLFVLIGGLGIAVLASACSGPAPHPWGVARAARPRSKLGSPQALHDTFEAGLSGFVHEQISFDPDGCYRRLYSSDVRGESTEERYEQHGADVLLFEAPPPPPGSSAKQPRVAMRLLRWEPRLYLIGDGQWLEFCNAINLGDEPRRTWSGPFFLKTPDWELDVREAPELPREWRDYVLPEALYGKTIVGLEDAAWIDLGAEAGVKPGMRFVVRAVPAPESTKRFKTFDAYVDVAVVEPKRSLVRFASKQRGVLTAGLQVCTRPFVMNADRVRAPAAESKREDPPVATALVLDTWSGLGNRTRVTLAEDGQALWEGVRPGRKPARYGGVCDRGVFDGFARAALDLAIQWEATAPSRAGRWMFDGSYARLTIRKPDDTAVVIGTVNMQLDKPFAPLFKELVRYIDDEISWSPIPGEPELDN
jgi:hypothetical protein